MRFFLTVFHVVSRPRILHGEVLAERAEQRLQLRNGGARQSCQHWRLRWLQWWKVNWNLIEDSKKQREERLKDKGWSRAGVGKGARVDLWIIHWAWCITTIWDGSRGEGDLCEKTSSSSSRYNKNSQYWMHDKNNAGGLDQWSRNSVSSPRDSEG